MFFCKYNDPSYVKMEKLDIMMKLVNERNIDQVRGRRRLPGGRPGRVEVRLRAVMGGAGGEQGRHAMHSHPLPPWPGRAAVFRALTALLSPPTPTNPH